MEQGQGQREIIRLFGELFYFLLDCTQLFLLCILAIKQPLASGMYYILMIIFYYRYLLNIYDKLREAVVSYNKTHLQNNVNIPMVSKEAILISALVWPMYPICFIFRALISSK